MHIQITETRHAVHPRRPDAIWRKRPDKKGEWRDDPGGEGTQIVREARRCPGCVKV